MSVIPSKIIPSLSSGGGGGGDTPTPIILSSTFSSMPDYSRPVCIEKSDYNYNHTGVVFKINVPGYILNLSKANGYEQTEDYTYTLASHPGYFLNPDTDNGKFGYFIQPDFLERTIRYGGDVAGRYCNPRQIPILPGTSTYFTLSDASSTTVGDSAVWFVPCKGVPSTIDKKLFVTPIYARRYPPAGAERRRSNLVDNKWIQAIFAGDWTDNFDSNWNLKQPNFILPDYKFHGVNGAFNTWKFWQMNPLLTGKDRVWCGTDGHSSYVLRYITYYEAAKIFENTTEAYRTAVVGANRFADNGDILKDGSGNLTTRTMTRAQWIQFMAERWCVLYWNYSSAGSAEGSDRGDQYTFNRSLSKTYTDFTLSDDSKTITPGSNNYQLDPIIDNIKNSTFLPDGYEFTDEIINPSVANVAVPESCQVSPIVPSGFTNSFNDANPVLIVSRERFLDAPPSGFGETDFENRRIVKSGDDYIIGTNGNQTEDELNQVKWVRCMLYATTPTNVSGFVRCYGDYTNAEIAAGYPNVLPVKVRYPGEILEGSKPFTTFDLGFVG